MEGVATLQEVDGRGATYSFDDVMKANALLDMRADAQPRRESE